MKFIINTNYKSAGSIVLNGIERRLRESGYSVSINDWDNYQQYDIAIFMAPDSKIKEAKKQNPKLFCILFDNFFIGSRNRFERFTLKEPDFFKNMKRKIALIALYD